MQRLISVTYLDGTMVDYVYDNLGNRLMQTTTLPASPTNMVPTGVGNPGIPNGAVNVSYVPVLTWPATSDPDGSDSVAYYLYFGTNATPPLIYSGWQTTWSPGPLPCYTTYYWYVVARDNHNTQTASPLWSFTTGDVPPAAGFSAQSPTGVAPLTVSFQDQSLHPCGTIASWQWSFHNDGRIDSTNQNPSFTYTSAGDYSVRLTVTDQHGFAATVVQTNLVSVLGPNIIELVPLELSILSAGPYGNLVVSYAVTNTGTISLSGKWQWSDWFYLSPNSALDSSASLVGVIDESQALPAGTVYRRTNLVLVVGTDLTGQFLYLNADGANALEEINTNDNVIRIPADKRLPDLVPGGVNWSGQAIAGQPFNITYSVTNIGPLDVVGLDGTSVDFFDGLFISTNSTFDSTASYIGSGVYTGTLPTGASYTQTDSAYLPNWPAGNYWIFVKANYSRLVAASSPSKVSPAMPVSLGAPILAPVSASVPQGVPSDSRITILDVVTNKGSAPAMGFWVDTLYLSTNAFWDTNAYSLAQSFQNGPVPSGGSYTATNSVRLPGWAAGTYYLLVQIDTLGSLSGNFSGQNVLAVPIALTAPAGLPDLVPFSLLSPGSALPGASIQVVYGVTNSGPTPVVGNWIDELWFSSNAVWDSTAAIAGFQSVNGPLNNGNTYFETNEVTIPSVAAGTYYFIVQVNAGGLAEEATSTNNSLSTPFTVLPASLLPDLAVASFQAPASALPGATIQVSYTVTNKGGSTASGSWFDTLVLSTNTTAAGMVGFFLGFWNITDPVVAGGAYGETNTVVLPSAPDGPYYLVLSLNAFNSLNEFNTNNDTFAMPFTLGQPVVPPPTPIFLNQVTKLSNGSFRFGFTNTPGASFTVFATTNVSLPFSLWTATGSATETSPGQFQFSSSLAANGTTHFYRVRSP